MCSSVMKTVDHSLTNHQIIIDLMLEGGNNFIRVAMINASGSNVLNLFYNEAYSLNYIPGLFPKCQAPVRISTPAGVIMRKTVAVNMRVVGGDGLPISGWMKEMAGLVQDTGPELRLSGGKFRESFYIATAPSSMRGDNLYIYRTKTALIAQLPGGPALRRP